MKPTFILFVFSLLVFSQAYAETGQDKKSRGEHRHPPAAALEACASSVQGDPCSFEGRRGEAVEGSCEAPEDKPLACRPEGGPPRDAVEPQ